MTERPQKYAPRVWKRKLRFEPLESRLVLSLNPFPAEPFATLANGMPVLNSLPSAPAAIYLDFDGGIYHGTERWTPYTDDANGSSFNQSEQQVIYDAWRQTAIYFAMFNVNVTTIHPSKPLAWILIGGGGDGGQSWLDVFPNVRAETIVGQEASKTRVSVFAHEIGHNFGNDHTSEYNLQGEQIEPYRGEFSPLRGPIMGADWTGIIHSWSWWHNATGANSLQDDMATIADDLNNYGGDGYRADDHGGSPTTATPLMTVGSSKASVGILERLTDVDVFSLSSTGGRYSIVAGRDGPSSVDLKLSIFDAAGNLLASEDGDPNARPYSMVNDHHLALDLPAGTFYIQVSSHGNYADVGQYVVRVDPLPDGWTSEGVGLLGQAGYSSYDRGTDTFTVAGSGADIFGTQDNFQFLYQKLDGNGEIVVRVDSIENTAPWAKAGIMIRESLGDNVREAYLVATPSNGLQWSARTSRGGATSAHTPNVGAVFTPVWLKLARNASTMRAYRSDDGISWTQVGLPLNVAMGTTVYIGMVASAVNNARLNTAHFSSIEVTGALNTQPVLNSLLPPSSVTISEATDSSARLSWIPPALIGDLNNDKIVNTADVDIVRSTLGADAGAGDANGDGKVDLRDYNLVKNNVGTTFSYVIESSTDGVNFSVAARLPNSITSYTQTDLSGSQTYFYRVRTSNLDGNSEPSERVLANTKPAAVTNVRVISFSSAELVIDWTDASGESSYRIERSVNGVSGWTIRGILSRNRPAFNDTGLVSSTIYYYRISTVGPGGQVTALSQVASGTTKPMTTLAASPKSLDRASLINARESPPSRTSLSLHDLERDRSQPPNFRLKGQRNKPLFIEPIHRTARGEDIILHRMSKPHREIDQATGRKMPLQDHEIDAAFEYLGLMGVNQR